MKNLYKNNILVAHEKNRRLEYTCIKLLLYANPLFTVFHVHVLRQPPLHCISRPRFTPTPSSMHFTSTFYANPLFTAFHVQVLRQPPLHCISRPRFTPTPSSLHFTSKFYANPLFTVFHVHVLRQPSLHCISRLSFTPTLSSLHFMSTFYANPYALHYQKLLYFCDIFYTIIIGTLSSKKRYYSLLKPLAVLEIIYKTLHP